MPAPRTTPLTTPVTIELSPLEATLVGSDHLTPAGEAAIWLKPFTSVERAAVWPELGANSRETGATARGARDSPPGQERRGTTMKPRKCLPARQC